MKLLKQCTLDSVSRRKDKSLKISFITNLEQSSTELMEVDKLLDTSGILYYKEGEGISNEEILAIDETKLDNPKGKSESQQTLIEYWKLWKSYAELGKYSKEFKVFYSAMMQKHRLQIAEQRKDLYR